MEDNKTEKFFAPHSAKFRETNQHCILNLHPIRINKMTEREVY